MGEGASCRDHRGRSVASKLIPDFDCGVRVTGLLIRGLLAIVLGFRISGLARNQARRAAGTEFLGSPREPTG